MNIPSSYTKAPDNIYEHPYSVLTSYVIDGKTYEGQYQNKVNVQIGNFNGMNNALEGLSAAVKGARDVQRAKEKALFDSFITQMPDGLLKNDFNSLINAKNYSKAFDIYMKFQQGLFNFQKTYEENKKNFLEKNGLFLTKNFMSALAEELQRSDVNPFSKGATFGTMNLDNLSADDIIDGIIKKVQKEALDSNALKDSELKAYDQYLEQMKIYLQNIFGEYFPDIYQNIGGNYNTNIPLSKLEESKWVKSKRKEKKYSDVPLNKLIWNKTWGLLNGMGLEVYLDFSGGVKTGKVTDNGKNIKTDVIFLANAQGEFITNDKAIREGFNEIVNNSEKATKKNLEKFLSANTKKDDFIIMVSAKDQSISTNLEQELTGKDIKIAEPSSLNKRLEDIKTFGESSGLGGSSISDLCFALVNLEQDMVCAGQTDSVRRALGAICANWMFDDADQIFSVPAATDGNEDATKIYVYNISGGYFTLSDILDRVAQRIDANKNTDMVAVELKVSEGSYDASLDVPSGIERWDAVVEHVKSNTTLGFQIKAGNLFKYLFNIK